jgi:hypothetical protein
MSDIISYDYKIKRFTDEDNSLNISTFIKKGLKIPSLSLSVINLNFSADNPEHSFNQKYFLNTSQMNFSNNDSLSNHDLRNYDNNNERFYTESSFENFSRVNGTVSFYFVDTVYIWLILCLSIFVLVGFAGNLLVCMAIKMDRKLQNATNYYLFSLAVTDLLVSIIVIPLAIIRSLQSEQHLTLFFFINLALSESSHAFKMYNYL